MQVSLVLLYLETGVVMRYAVSLSIFPVSRPAAKMHYSKNESLALLTGINYAIRKTIYKAAPDVFFHDRPCSWIIDNVLNSSKYLD